jgi:hypothetical protein
LGKADLNYSPLWEKGGSGGILDADPIAGTSYPIVDNIVLRVVIERIVAKILYLYQKRDIIS